MKHRTLVLKKEDLENMPKTTHEFKVIKHRMKQGQNFKVDQNDVESKHFLIDDNGYLRAVD